MKPFALLPLVLAVAHMQPAYAAIYKCPGPSGQVQFSDRPCNGAAESPGSEIKVKPPKVSQPDQQSRSEAELDKEWEDARRFYYVELPDAERKAAELMASPDPKAQDLGRKLAWEAQKGREAFEELKKAHEQRAETKQRYKDALRKLGSP
ncbi:DUF4124 domain-containing protein [Pseudomonas otitidis]|uniref:DUF4124 domain-containing protein n=1 Tax=Metapseudomonas otitidis TaxID=319939 RepID=A0A7X3KX23_9GAMM|nr:DUF4124 domain-containing protein [Pseudomonas otitidis]MWK59404.1 DUF4124 domain-containing protein [Pseudomonas otitidis]